jgi:hypothetical protein
MPDEWYYTQEGRGRGPVSEARLKELLDTGQLRPNDILWKEGITQKIKVESLFAAREQPEAPPAPAEAAPPAAPPPAVPDWLGDVAGAEQARAAGRQLPPESQPLDWLKDVPPPRSPLPPPPPPAAAPAAEPAAAAAEPPPAEPAADADVELLALAADFTRAAAEEQPARERPAPAPAQPPQRGPGRFLLLSNLFLSGAALVLAVLALGLHFYPNALRPALAHYDFSTPRAALVSRLQMQLRGDVPAAMELQALTAEDRLKEELETLEVRWEAEWQGIKVLFIAFRQAEVWHHSAVGFERNARTGYWIQVPLRLDDMRADNSDLAKQIESWEKEGHF